MMSEAACSSKPPSVQRIISGQHENGALASPGQKVKEQSTKGKSVQGRGTQTHPKPDDAVLDDGVDAVTVGKPTIARIVVPTAATENTIT